MQKILEGKRPGNFLFFLLKCKLEGELRILLFYEFYFYSFRFILNRHPELFEKNLIDMEPKVKRYMPRATVTQKNANLELLEVRT